MFRHGCLALGLAILVGITAPIAGQEVAPQQPLSPAPDYVGPTIAMPTLPGASADGPWSVFAPRLSAGYTTGPGFGYQYGYTTLDAFWPILGADPNRLFFVDTRALLSDDRSQWGNNIEFGFRRYNPDRDRIAGIWNSWDLRNTSVATYNQIAGGLESWGRYFDAHANYYAVTGPQSFTTGTFLTGAPILTPHNVLLPSVMNYQSALSGTDLEAGGPLPVLGRYGFRAYAGGYAYHADTFGDVGGGQIRFLGRISNNFDMNLQIRMDNAFGTTVAFTGALRWGGVRRAYREPERDSVFNRIEDPTQRNVAVSVLNKSASFNQLAINPATGKPFFIVYVNNGLATNGDGSFQNPFNSLTQVAVNTAGNNGIIALEPSGNGTNRQNTGVALLPGQFLLGTGVPNLISAQQGTFALPAIGSGTPVITNAAGSDVVTLSSNNEIGNFNITAAGTSNGITGSNINNFNIHGIVITGPGPTGTAGNGINLTDATGTGTISGVTATMMGGEGLAITQNTGSLGVNVSGSHLDANDLDGVTLTSNHTSTLSVTMQNTTANTNGVSTSSDGINATANDMSTLNLSLNNVASTGNGCCGLSLTAVSNSTSTGSTINATVTNSNLSGNIKQGIDSLSDDSSVVNLHVSGTTFDSNQGTAIEMRAFNNSVNTFTASGNTITNNATGVTLFAFNNSTVTATFTNNVSSGATPTGVAYGFEALGGGNATVNATVSGNTFANNTDIGVLAQAQNSAQVRVTVSGNQITGGTTGLQGEKDDTGYLGLTATSNTLSNQTNTSVFLTETGTQHLVTGDLNAVVTNNTITGSPTTGFLATNQVGVMGLGLHNNVSTGTSSGYDLNASAGTTINLERDSTGAFPPFTPGGTNTGTVITPGTGTINNVPFGSVTP